MRKFLASFICFVSLAMVITYGDEPNKGYRGYVDASLGDAYNFNTAQTISTNNMQLFGMISSTHGVVLNNWFLGGGVGYYHTFRDGENMFPVFALGRYTFGAVKKDPYIETRAGIVFDPLWVRKVQVYGALSAGLHIHNRWQVGLRLSMFSRPSRYFTANAAVVVAYAFGK